jgi:hypothetical protein
MSETRIYSPTGNSTKVVNDQTGVFDIYNGTYYETATKALGTDILGFDLNVGDLVWYVDVYSEPLKIGEIISKTKTLIRVKSMISGTEQYERSLPRYRVHKLDITYLTSFVQKSDGFELPASSNPVTDIAGNVLQIGDPVIFSNREEKGFQLGVVYGIDSPTRILVKKFINAITKYDCSSDYYDKRMSKADFDLVAPSYSTNVIYGTNVTRTSNVLKVTDVANRDIQEFYGLPHLLTLVKLCNVLVDDEFKNNESHLYHNDYYSAASGRHFTVVVDGVEHTAILAMNES